MSLGSLAFRGTPLFRRALVLTYGGYTGNTTVTPTLPAVAVPTLFVGIVSATTGTLPTFDGAWTLWNAQAHPNGSQSIAAYYRLVDPSTPTVTITGASGLRSFWRFTNAAPDTLQFHFGTTTTLDWTAQPTMAPISLFGAYLRTTSAQTDITAPVASALSAGLTTRTPTSTSNWAADSGQANVAAFDPSSGTFDTAPTRWSAATFTVKRAA